MLQNLARECKGAGHDSYLAGAIEHGVADVDHELTELLRRSDGVVDHGAIARQIHDFGEVLRSPEFGHTIAGLPDHLARSAARDMQAHEPDLAQLGISGLDEIFERVIDVLDPLVGSLNLVAVGRAADEIVRSKHPYKEALKQILVRVPASALLIEATPLMLACPPVVPVVLAATIGVHFIVGRELMGKGVAPMVTDHLDCWARKHGLVRRYTKELARHRLLCALGRTVRGTSRDLHRQFGRAERQATNALRPRH